MSVFKLDDGSGYVIGSGHRWLPGVYDTDKTARYAFQFSDLELAAIQNRKNGETPAGGTITLADLRAVRVARASPEDTE